MRRINISVPFYIPEKAYIFLRYVSSLGGKPYRNLLGDREVEWSYIASRIGRYAGKGVSVLDFGCGTGNLSYAAASLGARVLAIDLIPRQFGLIYPDIEFRQTDVLHLDESREDFDLVLNCSTIEHVGLGGRYNSIESADGDLDAMKKLDRLLKPKGIMLLTLPVGQDAVIRPLHRIYGPQRLPRLLEGFQVLESSFWRKNLSNAWISCSEREVLSETGNDHYYALGCMVLQKD